MGVVTTGVLIGSTQAGVSLSTTGGTTPVSLRERRRDDILIKNATVVTLDPRLGTLDRGDVLIRDNKIKSVATKINVSRWGVTVIDGTNTVVMPGLVDNHRHLWTRLFAGVSVDHLFGPYFQLISQRASQRLTPDHMRLACYVGGMESLNAGITTVLDWNHACYTREHAHAAIAGLHRSGVRGVFGYAAPSIMYGPDVPPTDDDITAIKRAIDALPTLTLAIPPRSPRQVTTVPGGFDRIRADIELARDLGVPVTMHTGLDTDEDFRWLLDNELVGPDSTYIHANMLTERTFRAIAERGGFISSSPEVEQQMFGLRMPLGEMLRAGVKITMSSDLPASQRADLAVQAKFGLQTQRMVDYQESGGTAPVIPTELMLRQVTTVAAQSLGLEYEIGSLTPGKKADVIMVRRDSPSTLGVADPVVAVLAYSTLADIDTVIANGRVVKRHGRLTQDPSELHHRVLTAQRELLAGL